MGFVTGTVSRIKPACLLAKMYRVNVLRERNNSRCRTDVEQFDDEPNKAQRRVAAKSG